MKSLLVFLFAFQLILPETRAQSAQSALSLALNKNVLQPGDSLAIKAHYDNNTSLQLATLELIIENEQGRRSRLRWPLINGEAAGTLYLPGSLQQGRYQLMAAVQPRFFEVTGEVKNNKKIGGIQAMLLTRNGEWVDQAVTVAPDGTFSIRNWLLEDDALLAFSANNNKQPLDIRISTRLDSGSAPLAIAARSFYVGNPSAGTRNNLDAPVDIPAGLFNDKGSLLPGVFVRTTMKTAAQQYDDDYVRGLFRGGNERILSIMDDPIALSSYNILSYLQGRVAGLQIRQGSFNEGAASWRGSPVTFYVDEMRVPVQTVASLPMTDIAIVKAFPPPFMGNFGGGGGAVAVYTRRGGEARYLPVNRHVFKVKGFTAPVLALDMEKLLP